MTILPQLEKNKGTVSSKLGKALADDEMRAAIARHAEAYIESEVGVTRTAARRILNQLRRTK